MNKGLQYSAILIFFVSILSCREDPVPPSVETIAVSEISATTATCGGVILDSGGSQITSKGVCWNTSDNPTTENNKITNSGESDTFVSSLNQLHPNTIYYVRSFAINSAGTGYGNSVSFTTLGQAPRAVTLGVSNLQSNSATVNGNVNPNYLPTTVTFEWGTTTDYGNTASPAQNIVEGDTQANLSAELTDLSEGTTYHVRIKATNQIGTIFGEDIMFTTPAPPAVMTTQTFDITTTSAAILCDITEDFGAPITECGVCWSASENPTTSDHTITFGTPASGFYTIILTDLSPNTSYFIRAYAKNSIGTGYGNGLVVKTYSGTVTDHDGNIYNIVTIGSQEWMAENLKTSRYSDGTTIPLVNSDEQWQNLSSPGYCWYQNDQVTYGNLYGALYNWYTINTGILCPAGWHVPTDAEWTLLENYLINNNFNYDGTFDFNKIAKSLASTVGWTESNFTGSPGNLDYSYKRNASGFSALPGGIRSGQDGTFSMLNFYGAWWTSSYGFYSNTSAYRRGIRATSANIEREEDGNLRKGLSVRCIKDGI